jgi:transcription elongation factor Elf1
MSRDACASIGLGHEHSVTVLIATADLYSQWPAACVEGVAQRNERTVQALLLLLDASVAVAGAIDDNILEDLQALPVDANGIQPN